MKVDIELFRIIRIFVPLFVQDPGSFTMCFTHEIIFTLPSETESFGSSTVTAIPCLGSTVESQQAIRHFQRESHLCRNLLRRLPCLKASARAFRYAWFPLSPVSSHGMC